MYRRLLILAGAMAPILLLACGVLPAQAASPTLTLATAPDPTESITTQLLASGTAADTSTTLQTTIKPTGGQGCAANASADQSAGGRSVRLTEGSLKESFSLSANETFGAAGSYLFCGWMSDSGQAGDPVVATASTIITVRQPHLLLSISAPPIVSTGQIFQLVTTAQAEVSRSVLEDVIPNTGRGCPANASAAGSTAGVDHIEWPNHYSLYEWAVTGGPFAESVNETINTAGQYVICAYFQYPNNQSPPELTTSAPIAAVPPPPPCKVPTSAVGTKLKSAERAIHAGGCAVGKVRRLASRKVRAGLVISLSPSTTTALPPGTPVAIAVSTGPPCIVPSVPPGTTLGRTELRLLANHCAVGKIGSARSRHVRRGRVLRLGARSGQVLPSHAPVTIVLAKRRR